MKKIVKLQKVEFNRGDFVICVNKWGVPATLNLDEVLVIVDYVDAVNRVWCEFVIDGKARYLAFWPWALGKK